MPDIFDETDWSPEVSDNFTNHDQWPARKRYKAMVDAKQYLNGEAGSPVNVGCELVKYGELKGVIAGTTSILGAAIIGDKKCYGSVARTIDQRPNGLSADKVQAATLFPRDAGEADKICANFDTGSVGVDRRHGGGDGTRDPGHREHAVLGDGRSKETSPESRPRMGPDLERRRRRNAILSAFSQETEREERVGRRCSRPYSWHDPCCDGRHDKDRWTARVVVLRRARPPAGLRFGELCRWGRRGHG